MSRFRIGIDIGGTFTDFVLVDEMERRIHLGKRLTTHGNYLDAVLGGGDFLFDDVADGGDLDSINAEKLVEHAQAARADAAISSAGTPLS